MNYVTPLIYIAPRELHGIQLDIQHLLEETPGFYLGLENVLGWLKLIKFDM